MNRHRTLRMTAVAVATAVVLAGCSSDETTTATMTTAGSLTGTITMSAAASLTGAFTTIKDDFTRANPKATVSINFGSSGQLATQIQSGAPADVAAFADTAPMTTLETSGLLTAAPKIFARNQLVIVTKPGNPKGVKALADLATAGTISQCAATAPCGKFADQVLAKAGVTIPPTSVTRGQDVKTTLAAVTQGDADAAIVYATDAKAAGSAVSTVEITDNVIANYPIAVVKATDDAELAQGFEDFVLGPTGRAVLKSAGFLAP